jgi:hypothetical protein
MLQYRSNKHSSSIKDQQEPHLTISSSKSCPGVFLGYVEQDPNLGTEHTQRKIQIDRKAIFKKFLIPE